jgi:hypothetical protein
MNSKDAKVAALEAKVGELESTIRQLKKMLSKAVGDLEKRTILRTGDRENCRVCVAHDTGREPSDPPLSKLEEDFCKAGHGSPPTEKGARGKKPQRLPLDWEDVLNLTR